MSARSLDEGVVRNELDAIERIAIDYTIVAAAVPLALETARTIDTKLLASFTNVRSVVDLVLAQDEVGVRSRTRFVARAFGVRSGRPQEVALANSVGSGSCVPSRGARSGSQR